MLERFCWFFSLQSTSHCIKTVNLHCKRRLSRAREQPACSLLSCWHCSYSQSNTSINLSLMTFWHSNQFIRCSLCKPSPARPGQDARPLLMHNAWSRYTAQYPLTDRHICYSQAACSSQPWLPEWSTPMPSALFSFAFPACCASGKLVSSRRDVLVQKHTYNRALWGEVRVCQTPTPVKGFRDAFVLLIQVEERPMTNLTSWISLPCDYLKIMIAEIFW